MPEIEDPLSVEAPASGADGPVRNLKKSDAPLAGDRSPSGQSSEGEGSNAASAADQMVTVPWNGAPRQMSLSELARLAQDAHRAQEIEQSARSLIREDAELQALKARIEQFGPEEQQAFREFMMNPSGFRRPGAAAAVRQEHEQAMNAMNGQSQSGANPQIEQQLNLMAQAVQALLQREQERDQQGQARSREQQVDELMGSFPVFSSGHPKAADAKGIARGAILAKLSSSPGAKIEDVVAGEAAAWNSILAAETQNGQQQEEVVTWPSGGQPVGQQQQPISNPNQSRPAPRNMREAKAAARNRLFGR